MRRLALLSVLLAAALGGALTWSVRSRSSATGRAAEAAPTETRTAARSPGEPDAARPGPEPSAPLEARSAAPEASAPPPEPQGVEERGAVSVQDYAKKYAQRDRRTLERDLGELSTRVEALAADSLRARFEAGRFVEHAIDPGDPRSLEELLRALRPDGELSELQLVPPPDAGAPPGSARPTAVRVATLPRAEFPALYALADERDWLRIFMAPSGPQR